MIRPTFRLVLVWLFFTSSSLPQTAMTHTERVCLSEMLISHQESDNSARVYEARHKAERLRNAVQTGSSFSDLAKANSQGPTAAQGGAIGCFKRGQLSNELEEQVFRLQVGEVSNVLHTKQGFVLLQVTEHDAP